jgi:septal ring factor EnvC (AmiA/AmiB activator)
MDEQNFQSKMTELLARLKDLPEADRSRIEQLATETKDRRAKLQGSITELQESLDYLRLSVKYLVFDLEATRRENAYLRKMLEQSNRTQNKKRKNTSGDNFLEPSDD